MYDFLQMAAQLRERQLGDMLQDGTDDEGENGCESEEDCASEGDCDSAEGEEGCESVVPLDLHAIRLLSSGLWRASGQLRSPQRIAQGLS